MANPFSLFLIVVALNAIAWGFDRFSARLANPVNG
jgi:hypothetical protein